MKLKAKKPEIPQDELTQLVKDSLHGAKAPKVIRHYGTLNWVEVEGQRIERQEKILMFDRGEGATPVWVKCTPYDNHFIYKYTKRKGWTTFCTCGSPAVVVNYDAYKQYGSQQGALLVCYWHTVNGRHADGSQ